MEDVLDVYERPYDPKVPVVCFDERPCQLLSDVRPALPMRPGSPARQDSEYQRHGTANVFAFLEPLGAWRHMAVTEHRAAPDFAHCMKYLCDDVYPDAERIVVVLDNLSTHAKSALYATFSPAEAHRLAHRLEFHFTPKHGSWLNAAECELSVLVGQCLDRRIGDLHTLASEIAAWERERNRKAARVDWQFRTPDARIKLKRLYPVFAEEGG